MDEPKIGEKVKFWQEQDRINRELIPRVIKNHELLSRHVESHEDGDALARSQIATLESHTAESDEAARAQIEALEARVAELESSVDGYGQWASYAGIALAMVALALALVR